MTAPTLALAGLVRDLGRLVPQVRVDLDEKTGRLLPSLAPEHLWRVLPRMLRAAADIAETLKPELPLLDADPAAMRCLATWIERGQRPGVGA